MSLEASLQVPSLQLPTIYKQRLYESVRSELQGEEGNLLLVKMDSLDAHNPYLLQLGLLTSSIPQQHYTSIELPTDRCVVRRKQACWNSKWELHNGPMLVPFDELSRGMIHFKKGGEIPLYFKTVDVNGKTHLDTSFTQALDLLGVEAPVDFRKAYDSKVFNLRLRLLARLEELAAEAEVLRDDPTEEDRYDSNQWEIGQVLQMAFGEGMHKWNYDLMPRRGVTVNVGRFVRGLADSYGVKLPK